MTRLLLALLGVALVLAVSAGPVVPAASPPATASASAIRVVVPGQPGAAVGEVGGPATVTGGAPGFAYPADGSVVRTGASATSVTVRPGKDPHIQAAVDVVGISLFNGEITIDGVTLRAVARAGGSAAEASTAGSGVRNAVALGQPVSSGSVALGDWGSMSVLSASAERSDGEQLSGRAVAYGVRVVLSAPHGGLPAGSEILLGFAEASATAARAPAPAPPPAAAPTPAEPRPSVATAAGAARAAAEALRRNRRGVPESVEPRTGRSGPPEPPIYRPLPPGIDAELTPGRYVFPVYGPVGFGNTFGAPRASTGWHHGEDLFGQLGQPLLAVADGTLFSVGWNDVGGYRLWLRDRFGNQFYYAHLSAFSPLAVNGREVRAGQVIGFMGNTGEAITTPVHLHFEIHPVSLLQFGYDGAIEPYRYLTAWQRLEDVSFAIGQGWVPLLPIRANAPRPGAILLQSSDISSASGLDPRTLAQALVAPEPIEGDGVLDRG